MVCWTLNDVKWSRSWCVWLFQLNMNCLVCFNEIHAVILNRINWRASINSRVVATSHSILFKFFTRFSLHMLETFNARLTSLCLSELVHYKWRTIVCSHRNSWREKKKWAEIKRRRKNENELYMRQTRITTINHDKMEW